MPAQNWANLVVLIVSHTELMNWHVHVVPITYYSIQYRISNENLTSDTKSKSKSNAFDAKRTWRTTKHGIFVHDKVNSSCCLISLSRDYTSNWQSQQKDIPNFKTSVNRFQVFIISLTERTIYRGNQVKSNRIYRMYRFIIHFCLRPILFKTEIIAKNSVLCIYKSQLYIYIIDFPYCLLY